MHRNPETLTTLGSSCTKLLLPSWLLGFRHKERETQFLLCWLFHLTQQRAAHPVEHNWIDLVQIRKSTRFLLVQISTNPFIKNHPKSSAHRFRAWRRSHSQSYFQSGFFYYDICDCHILPAWAWAPGLNVCTCTCTKPNSSKPK